MDMERNLFGTNHYQIELLTNPDEVPEFGAIIVAACEDSRREASTVLSL